MESRIAKLTTSQMKCFKQCRRRYYLEYIENLKPIETPKPLEIGTLFHAGVAMILEGSQINNIPQLEQVEATLIDMARATAEKNGIDYDPANAYLAIEMVRAWNRDSFWHEWHVLSVEKSFEVWTGYAKRMMGKIDGIILHPLTGKPYLLEHKTTARWGVDGTDYLHSLLWDEQSTHYLYAYQKMLDDGTISGECADGVFYDIIEKPTIKPYEATPMEKRKYTKDGVLYANQHDRDETPEEFRHRVRAWYEEANRLHETFVYRTPAQIADQIKDFNLTLKDIVAAERDQTYYRNPANCSVLPCPYAPKCLEDRPDTDCLFVKKEARNEELI